MFNTTTDSILKVFTKTISKLEAHSAASSQRGQDLRAQADILYDKGNEEIAEALKAAAAAAKIKKLFD